MSLFNLDRFRYEKRRTSAEQDGRPAAAARAQEDGSPAAAAQAQEGSRASDGGGNDAAGSGRPGSPASEAAGGSGVVCVVQCEGCIARSKALCPSCAAGFFLLLLVVL